MNDIKHKNNILSWLPLVITLIFTLIIASTFGNRRVNDITLTTMTTVVSSTTVVPLTTIPTSTTTIPTSTNRSLPDKKILSRCGVGLHLDPNGICVKNKVPAISYSICGFGTARLGLISDASKFQNGGCGDPITVPDETFVKQNPYEHACEHISKPGYSIIEYLLDNNKNAINERERESVIHYLVYGIANLCPQYLTELMDAIIYFEKY